MTDAVNALVRGDADLRPGLHVDVAVGHTRRLAADGVDDGGRERATVARLFQRRQRVHRFAALRDRQHQVRGFHDRVAIAKLAGIVHLDGQPRQALDVALAHQPRIVARAAGHDRDFGQAARLRRRQVERFQRHAAARKVEPAAQRVGQAAPLLKDLLLHEVAIFALLGRHRVPVDRHASLCAAAPPLA